MDHHCISGAPACTACCRYSEDLEGVVLSFANERVLTTQASIHPYFPFVRLEVLADLVLFRPRPGMRLGECCTP